MRDPLRLRKSFKAGTKNDPRDVAKIADALRVTGFLPRPSGGGPAGAAPSEAAVGGALRSFQDREGLAVDGRARPGGATERHLSQMVERRGELATRPPRAEPLRFRPLAEGAGGELGRMARGLARTADHRGALKLFRRAFEDDPEGAVPEAIHFAGLMDGMDRKEGARFRATLVKTAREVDPALAPHVAAGRIVGSRGTRAGNTMLSPTAFEAGPRTRPTREMQPEKTRERTGVGSVEKARGQAADPDPDMARLEPVLRIVQAMVAAIPELRARIIQMGGSLLGFDMAAGFFKHYLDASGEPIALSRDEARALGPIGDAERANREHFERVFLDPQYFLDEEKKTSKPNMFHAALKDLRDGEKVSISNVAVSEDLDRPFKHPSLVLARPDFSLSIGGTIVNANGDFVAERRGSTIFITGTVRHTWNGRYDFKSSDDPLVPLPNQVEMTILEGVGRARPFMINAEWDQRVSGTIEIEDGKLGTIRLRWTDEPTAARK